MGEDSYLYLLIATTSVAILLLGTKRLGLPLGALRDACKELSECIGASIIFFAVNLAVGISIIFLSRVLGQFTGVYVMARPSVVLFSLGQGFLFQMWWRRSRT